MVVLSFSNLLIPASDSWIRWFFAYSNAFVRSSVQTKSSLVFPPVFRRSLNGWSWFALVMKGAVCSARPMKDRMSLMFFGLGKSLMLLMIFSDMLSPSGLILKPT